MFNNLKPLNKAGESKAYDTPTAKKLVARYNNLKETDRYKAGKIRTIKKKTPLRRHYDRELKMSIISYKLLAEGYDTTL